MGEQSNPDDLMEFPCHFQLKAIGDNGDDFCRGVVAAISVYAQVAADAVRTQPSRHGTYQSVSVVVTIYSGEQLTNIYAELKKVNGLKMLL